MRISSSAFLLVFANILLPFAVVVFAIGFFPYKPILPGLAVFSDDGQKADTEAPFNKVIFMVVDALRSDFVYSNESEFKFTQSLISSGNAIPYTAHAASPTITMPRIKAVTTGSVPSFLDVILNFVESDTSSNLANQDTWLSQIKSRGGRLVFYGDDTWLKLFPDFFDRADGTSSFFVSDYTEVDNNVTRHVPDELRAHDWDAMILHYLGLDHIGHKTGPYGPNMRPKQAEMDGIVEQVYKAMLNEPHLSSTLFMILGDHGMNEGGNHGGTAIGETSPALVFVSPKLKRIPLNYDCPPKKPKEELQYYKVVDQSDIVPTLASLLGLPISRNSLGIFITDFLPLWSSDVGVRLIQRNVQQLLGVVKAKFSSSSFSSKKKSVKCDDLNSAGDVLLCKYYQVERDLHPHERTENLISFCKDAQRTMSSAASDYNMRFMGLGVALSTISLISVLPLMTNLLNAQLKGSLLIIIFTLLYSIMMFASSFVEEEQHFWYWCLSAWIAYLYFYSSQSIVQTEGKKGMDALYVTLLFLHRIAQRWNQTGQKFAGADDISHTFLSKQPLLLWILIAATYLRIFSQFKQSSSPRSFVAAIAVCSMAFFFKLSFTLQDAPELLSPNFVRTASFLAQFSLISQARSVFFGIFLTFALRLYGQKREYSKVSNSILSFQLFSLFLITQSRAQNIPLFLLFDVQARILGSQRLKPLHIAISSLLLSHASFFALGNSNAISSIDLSNAYNGVSGYNALAVALLLFASNWAGPIWWTMAGVLCLTQCTESTAPSQMSFQQHLSNGGRKDLLARSAQNPAKFLQANKSLPSSSFQIFITIYTFFFAGALQSIMVACFILRDHLFIWSVFSPKYLYVIAWTLAFHLFTCVGVGSVSWCLKQS